MNVLVTGAAGQLGSDVMAELTKRGHEAIGVDVQEMDITNADACTKVITEAHPDAVIHCAAWTAVDAAEDNVDTVRLVNAVIDSQIISDIDLHIKLDTLNQKKHQSLD
jgi:dTDP-4-dehydrorhamnose reductase